MAYNVPRRNFIWESVMVELRILGVNCAYTRVGPVAQMLTEALEACQQVAEIREEASTSIEIVHLVEIPGNTFSLPVQGVIPDHMHATVEKLLKADIVIFASPTFWSMPSPLFSQFMVDITPLEGDADFPLRGKVAGAISHCDDCGAEKVVSDMFVPLRHFGFATPPHPGPWRNRRGAAGSYKQWQLHDHTHVLAPNLVAQAVAFKKANPEWL